MSRKPCWKNSPEWAMWLSRDQDGQWCWWEFEPKIHSDTHWFEWDGRELYLIAKRKGNAAKWRNSLEPRP